MWVLDFIVILRVGVDVRTYFRYISDCTPENSAAVRKHFLNEDFIIHKLKQISSTLGCALIPLFILFAERHISI